MAEKKRPYDLHVGDVADAYASWPSPTCIISDGAYGVRGFHGDTTDEEGLVDWYAPHIEQWTKAAAPGTALRVRLTAADLAKRRLTFAPV